MLRCQTEVASNKIATDCPDSDWAWSVTRRDAMIRHPDLTALYRLWLTKTTDCTKRRPRPWLASFDDFSLDDLEPWIGRISIAREVGDDFELELLGCVITDENGRDCSRVCLSDASFGPVGQDAKAMLETVVSMSTIALPAGRTVWRGRTFGWHGIVLPLANRMALTCLFVSDTE